MTFIPDTTSTGPRPLRPQGALEARLHRRYGLLGRLARASRIRGRRRVARLLVRYPTSLTYRDTLGLTRHTDLDDTIDAYWFLGVNCGLPRAVIERVPANATAVDAGANIGVVAGQLCRAVGPRGTVHAIEPLPANVRRLHELKRDNALDQLIIWECALSDESGPAILRTDRTAGTSGHASFTASWMTHAKMPVVTRVLDEIVPDSTHVGFIKLDIEGAESAALGGATRIMRSDRPLVFCEFNDIILRDAGSSAEALLRKFAGFGYAPAPEYTRRALHLSNTVTDLLLVPE
jgi:FkbM family methyltransferase